MSGYTTCPCCGDVTVSSSTDHPELCLPCEDAGCILPPDGCARDDFDDEPSAGVGQHNRISDHGPDYWRNDAGEWSCG